MRPLIECVPNFSEGRDMHVIRRITGAIEQVTGVTLLHVDPGESANRTVVTFVGDPDAVVEAAFQAIRVAAATIDMRTHHGAHPRMGATDVCPLVPLRDITLEETVAYARRLAARVGEELGIPVYLYEAAAARPERRNLAVIRQGEYEALSTKLEDPEAQEIWRPDFGPQAFNPRTGATVIGARKLLVAYNVNLNTTSMRRANAVAFDIRERGRILRENNRLTGAIVRDEEGEPMRIPGTLKSVKAKGWYLAQYGICQVSMNLTDLDETPLHVAFDEVCEKARARGLRVTGSQVVGMVPLHVLRAAGEHYLRKQQRSLGIPEREIIAVAVRTLGLNELAPFDPEERIIEYALRAEDAPSMLLDQSVRAFVNAVGSESPTPGGGSVSALVGALGAALATMVANGSAHKRGWDDRWETFSDWAVRGREVLTDLIQLVDADAAAYDAIVAARRLPGTTEAARAVREAALADAMREATEVPLRTMRAALEALKVAKAMAEIGNPNALSDAVVGGMCAEAAVGGAFLTVQMNVRYLEDADYVRSTLNEGRALNEEVRALQAEVLALAEAMLD